MDTALTPTPMNAFEELAQQAYTRFTPLAEPYYYRFMRSTVTENGTPCMLFLGNHSSGKSTLINWLLGGESIQDVGLAPTDDGFTVILWGETEEDVCGPAAVTRLPPEFGGLKHFGGNFLQHLRVKVRNRDLLKTVTLIDSPGMIDAAEHTVNRTYDFTGVVRLVAELCDMVFFLLDPDKPGTTGETVTVFSQCLQGMEFKLRVLLNKCDAFTSLYDFARTYGTMCWNLARVLHTKDLPKIWTIYSGETKTNASFDLADFNRHREEFQSVIKDAAARRRDNVYSQAQNDFLGLSIRMCVVNHLARKLASLRTMLFLFGALLSAAGGYLVWRSLLPRQGTSVVAVIAGALTAAFGLFAFHYISRLIVFLQRASLARRADEIFALEYRRQIAIGHHDNLNQIWHAIREETVEVMRKAPLHLPFFGEFRRRQLDAAAAKVFAAFNKAATPSVPTREA